MALDFLRYGELTEAARPPSVTPETFGALYQLRADVGVSLSIGRIASWAPRIGTGTVVAAGGEEPSYTASDVAFNGRPTANFNGSTERLGYAGRVIPDGTGCTVIAVGSQSGAAIRYLLGQIAVQSWYLRTNSAPERLEIESVAASSAAVAYGAGTSRAFAWTHFADTSNEMGVSGAMVPGSANRALSAGAGTDFAVGCWRSAGAGSSFWTGALAELCIYPPLSSANVAQLYAGYYGPRYAV